MAHPELLHELVELAVRHARQLFRGDFDVDWVWLVSLPPDPTFRR